MQRVLAVIGAVMIVALALVVRSAIDDGGGDGGRTGGDSPRTVVCDPDLRTACDALGDVDVRIEDSADTAAALASGDLDDVDAWITSSAWLEVARSRSEDGVLGPAEALATAPIVVASDPARAAAIIELCAGDPVWRCLADAAERPWGSAGGDGRWGPIRTGLPDPDTAIGLGVLSSVAVGWFGDTDFAANDFTDLRSPLARLAGASDRGDRNLVTSLVVRRGTYSAAGFVAPQVRDRNAELLPTEPVVSSSAVLVEIADGDGSLDAEPARAALVEAGWQPASGEPGTLLKSGVMAALHSLWTEIAR